MNSADRVWSLWDMVANFSVHIATWLFTELDILITVAGHNRGLEAKHGPEELARDRNSKVAHEQALESVKGILRWGENLQGLTKNSHIQGALDALKWWGEDEKKRWDDLFTRACRLRDTIRIELEGHLFYAYPKAKGQIYNGWETDWETVHAAFPEVGIDSFSATDCYALEHNTASVFHSMRVAEVGLRALAHERRVKLPKNKPIAWGNWHEIIKALDTEIGVIGQTWKAGERKDAALEFYSGARADLNGFKDEFRNLVMHVREQYDEFQALRALTRVREFMMRLSEKMDHKHHRIRW